MALQKNIWWFRKGSYLCTPERKNGSVFRDGKNGIYHGRSLKVWETTGSHFGDNRKEGEAENIDSRRLIFFIEDHRSRSKLIYNGEFDPGSG